MMRNFAKQSEMLRETLRVISLSLDIFFSLSVRIICLNSRIRKLLKKKRINQELRKIIILMNEFPRNDMLHIPYTYILILYLCTFLSLLYLLSFFHYLLYSIIFLFFIHFYLLYRYHR